jgi:lipid-binding SYLF domain-containing protein
MSRLDRLLILVVVLCSAIMAPLAMASDTKADARTELRKMRQNTLEQLYREIPQTRKAIRSAAGYGVFGVVSAQVLFLGGGGGRGIVRDNLTGKDTFMKVSSVSAGLGVGFKDVRTILIFTRRDVLKQFLDKGWTFGGETAAVARASGKGGGGGELEAPEGIKVYQLTKTGLMAQGTVQGTKYSKDDSMN